MNIADQKPRTPQFGAIVFRAAGKIGDQGADCFDRLGIDVDARKTSIILTLYVHGPLSSTKIAERIGHSRQMIEARLKALIADKFLIEYRDPEDARKRLYDFAESSRPTVDRAVSAMVDFEAVYDALWEELGVDLEKAILSMEKALKKRSLTERLIDQFPEHAATVLEQDHA